ncbi:leucine-rich repeat neuronal protein 2 [Calliphora vicina]|uniref:leucine-rich repeat neuronal protein 2 n=1 Tax=Calliphora vicina TaxID=7373 RepID=UPI00325AE54C
MVTNRKSWLIITALVVSLLCVEISSEAIEANDIELFCYPELHKNTRKSCECISEGSAPWGLRVLNIDCSFKSLLTADFSELLPPSVDRLDLTWNQLERVPMLASDSLTLLNLMHNNISMVMAKNFVKVANLRELYLSWNSIQTIEPYAFSDLPHLQVLDLSHNNLHNLAFQIFLPLQSLESLYLSWNRQLNQTEGIQELDFYQTYGVNNKLRTLKLKACNLNNIVLPKNVVLKELDLRRNSLTEVPQNLPEGLELIDLSENLFESLLESDTKRLMHIHELYMEDMPRLVSIEENSLVPLESLEKISFQNSRSLVDMHEYSFGQNATRSPKLHSMIFRGTALRGFNNTLSPIFFQLATLDLNGMPLHCDCNLVWLKEVRIETNGRCFKPSRLRGVRLAKANRNDFSCERWPRWVYGIIVLALIALCSICIYFIVVGLRPNGGVTMRRKVGAGSPYARVTIEPNRQEHY